MDDRPLLVRVLEAARRDLQGTDRTDLHAAASRCLFDALTCIAAGGTTEATTPSELASPRIGLDRTGGLLGTIAINAMAANDADLDDLHWPSLTHPGSMLWPALVAVGRMLELSLPSILDAAALGYQVIGRQSRLLGPEHRRYFHVSTSCGGVAVAAAVATLLAPSDDKVFAAMSHAASGMGGTAQAVREHSRTTMLHRAYAASIGTIAAFSHTVTPTVKQPFEGRYGMLAATGIRPELDLLDQPFGVVLQEMTLRRHPVTGFAHTLVDALLDLGPVDTSRIAAVDAEVPSYVLDLTFPDEPQTADQAAWSLRYVAAAALVGELPARRLRWPPDPATKKMRKKVYLTTRRAAPPDLAVSGQIRFADGASQEFGRRVPHGHPDQPFSDSELLQKAHRLGVLTPAEGKLALEKLRGWRGPIEAALF